MTMKKTLTGIVLASGVAFGAQAQDMPGEGVSVQAIQSPIAEETFQTMLVNQALTDLGYDVQPIQEVDYSAGYTSIANGDATYMAVNWYPLHNNMYKNAGGDGKFYRKGNYINGAAQGYLIDKKTAEKYDIDNIEDFKDPEIAKIFDTDGDGKADLTGCQAGWGCEGVIEHQLDAFKLRDSITHKQGQYAAIISDTITRYENGDSIFYYTWTPYWVSGILVPGKDVIWLEVPFSSNPNGADTKLPNGKNYGFEINSERIVANKAFAKANPAAAKLFEIMELSVNDVSAQNMKIRDGEDSQEQIMAHTQSWIKSHRETYDNWLKAARDAAE
ncbi:glycine betaine/L-proline ABC transporter substrate-binding protein ProX [Marinobacter sp. BGYM27]|uniref:glycine betaine/L-proline ABC transporter substrate-binding protein ProX n=1 Tax=Marinobacter sp. BGYM27 TaxID=2975597 RepID=UPI0021A8D06D|nr:glycine betaine/L-proline ABC transporter substrate-binding protein ProX [Marinobacter sp. BGYM27]MDG5500134.1 glycine betaine/L-proline ABC transporter substrate-binding protein ProX [Marinobacter sp. BGYM27]